MDLAVFGTPEGGLVVGEGPFEACAQPPQDGVAFYRNDFALEESTPWYVPRDVRELAPGETLTDAAAEVAVAWEEPEVDPFAEVFAEVSQAIPPRPPLPKRPSRTPRSR